MNYGKIYNDLINSRKDRILDNNCYYEKHHIIPKCMGGTNDKSNIIHLTAREHLLAHLLLTKIYPNYSKNYSGINAPNYGKVFSEEHRNNISKSRKGKYKGDKNPFYGKKHSEETRQRIRESRKEHCKKVINPDNEILSVMETAKKYNVSYSTIGYWIKHNPEKDLNGKIKFLKF